MEGSGVVSEGLAVIGRWSGERFGWVLDGSDVVSKEGLAMIGRRD